MAEIHPFQGVHYNESLIKDWSAVICPPHDIISPRQQEELYQRNEYNFVRLEYGRVLPDDTATDNRYTRSAATLEQWLKKGVLKTDKVPAIYLHDHSFTLDGKEYKRRSIIARVRLEEWAKMIIRPHENTMAVTRSDRLSLLGALQANTSPILAMFEDRQRQIYSQLPGLAQRPPLITSKIVNGEGHNLWAITDTAAINQITEGLAEQPIYVADGHHRYESALAYRNDKRASNKSGDASFNFVMMELVDFTHPGLKILAPHRLVRGISKAILDDLIPKLEEFFKLEKTPLSATDVRKQADDFFTETGGIRFMLFGSSSKDSLLKLRLRDPSAARRLMPAAHSEPYKKLDVSIADHIILEKVLGMTDDGDKTGLTYNHDLPDVVKRVTNQEYQLAILLSPVKPEVLKTIADAGDKMPPKSTYFYPKSPAGLVLSRLV